MSDKKKPVGQVLPEDQKENKTDYPDHLQSPLHEIESDPGSKKQPQTEAEE